MKNKKNLRHIIEADLIEKEIKNGKFGSPGNRFLSTAEVVEARNVSLVTAQRILCELKDRNLIELCGKKYFLTHGRIPNESPFMMKTINKEKLIGVHITNLESQFFASLAKTIEEYARAKGYRALIASSMYKFEEEKDTLEMFRRIGASGVLSCPGTAEQTHSLYENYVLPYVFLGRKPPGATGESVLVNNYPAARSMASHLISKGYQEFAYIGPSELNIGQDSRLAGFRDGLLSEGYTLNKVNIIQITTENINASANDLDRFLQEIKKPAGIFCFHDLLALSAVRACHKLKIEIPEMVGIAGFDNLPISINTTPQLTTVGYRIDEMARMAVHLLTNQIKIGKESDTNYYIEPSLMIRESTSNTEKVARDERSHPLIINDILYKISV